MAKRQARFLRSLSSAGSNALPAHGRCGATAGAMAKLGLRIPTFVTHYVTNAARRLMTKGKGRRATEYI